MAKKKEIEKKNYIIYALVVIFTLVLIFLIKGCYKAYKDHQLTIPVIADYVNEVKYEELSSFIVENPDFILYTCTSYEKECRDFERKFKDVIKDYNLKDKIVYLNLDSIVQDELNDDTDNFILKALNDDNYFKTYPKIAVFKDSVLLEYLVISNKVSVDRVVQLLEEYEIIVEE
ncbi:MAG: hypothetical protein PHS45_02765 [Bacilli bacterium]|nr:hypothetical protein [Bacilli bacterium]